VGEQVEKVGLPQEVDQIRLASIEHDQKTMVRLLAYKWNGSMRWWSVEDVTTGTRYYIHQYQLGDETYNEMEALAWASR
jgi:hypothetical protein